MTTITVSKARNTLHNKKLNYWDMYHAEYINRSDKVVAEYNTAEMYELEAYDYYDDYTQEEIKALYVIAHHHTEKARKLESLGY